VGIIGSRKRKSFSERKCAPIQISTPFPNDIFRQRQLSVA